MADLGSPMENLSDIATTLSAPRLAAIAATYGTPVWIYDADVIRHQIDRLRQFDVIRYAQKACSNLQILRLMRHEGVALDAVSLGELERSILAGYVVGNGDASSLVYTADLIDRRTLARVVELDVTVNVGSPQMLEQVGQAHPGHKVWIRINPGFGHGHNHKTNTGGAHSKHGIWFEQLADSYALLDRYGLDLVGLHMHIGSGADYHHLQKVCEAMVEQVRKCGRDISAVSAGGGLSVPYVDGEDTIDTDHYFQIWDAARKEIEGIVGHSVSLEIEPGRFLVAQAGHLVAEVRAHKQQGSNHFVLVDAGFTDLMRPAMYGSAHRISLMTADGTLRQDAVQDTAVAGPLCESGDVFTQTDEGIVAPVPLPAAEVGDLLVIHDTGAYGASMSSNYNSRPLLPEVLVDGNNVMLARRRQHVEEMLAPELDLDVDLTAQADGAPSVVKLVV